jgi:hypothetical protein
MADDAKQLQEDLKELERLASRLGKSVNFNNLKNDAEAVKELLKAWRKEIDEMNREFSDLSSTFKNVINDLRNFDDTSNRINKSFRTLGGLADKLKYDNEGISKLNKKDLETLQKKAKTEESNLLAAKKHLDELGFAQHSEEELRKIADQTRDKNLARQAAQYIELQSIFDENNNLREDENNYVHKLNKLIEGRLKKEKEIAANLGLMGAAYKGISNTLQKMGVDSDIIREMGEDLEKAAENGKIGFKQLFDVTSKGFKKAMEDPMGRFVIGLKLAQSGFNDLKKAFEVFKEFNAIFVEAARGVGMSVGQITDMVKQANNADTSIQGLNGSVMSNIYSSKQLAKAISDVNSQLGLSVDVGAETLNEFTAMTNQMGLSAEEATKIYKLGLLNNMSLEDTNKTIASGIIAAQKSTGIQLNQRQIFQEIGKLSAGITAKFQQNVPALVQAVAQAKSLGTTLEQVDKVGESLLNFETSIENELKAELLTGKQINLEKARYAALTGDQVTLTQELANQVGSLADFQNMNVIAQKSLAEAFGLSRDEVAEMLTKQETFNKLGDVSEKSAQEQLKIARERGLSETDSLVVNLKQQAVAEKLTATFDNLKTIFADLAAGPLGDLVDLMGWFSKHTWAAYSAIVLIGGISLAKTIGGLLLMGKELGVIAVESITASQALTFGLSALVIAGAIGGLMALLNSSKEEGAQTVQDGIAPSSKGPFTITDAYGATAITTKGDGLAVSPNINTTPLNSSRQSSINLSPITEAISVLSNTVNNLVNRPQPTPQFALSVDGRQLGTIVGNQMETGTAQNMTTSYKIA